MHWIGWEAVRRLRELIARAGSGGWHGPLRTALRKLVELDSQGSPYAGEIAMMLEDTVSEVRPAADAVVSAFTSDAALAFAAGRSRVSRVLVAALRTRARGRGPEALEDVVAAVESFGAAGRGLASALAEAARVEPDAAKSLVVLAARGRRGALMALAEALEGGPWSGASLKAASEALAREVGVPVRDALRLVEEDGVLGLARLLTGLRDAPRSIVAAVLSQGYKSLGEAVSRELVVEAIHRPGWPSPDAGSDAGALKGSGLSGDGWAAAALLDTGELLVVDPRGSTVRARAPRGAVPPLAAGRHGVALAVDTGSLWLLSLQRGGRDFRVELEGEPVAFSVAPWGVAALVADGGSAVELEMYRVEGGSLVRVHSVELQGEPVAVAASPGESLGAVAAVARGLGGAAYIVDPRGSVDVHPLESRPVAALWTRDAGPVIVSPERIHAPRLGRSLGLLVEASTAAALAGGRYLLLAPAGRGLPFYLADPRYGELWELRGGPVGPVDAAAVAGGSGLLLVASRGRLRLYPLVCSEACPPGRATEHRLEHPGCGAACRAYREGRGPQGYIAGLIRRGRYVDALAASVLLARKESWGPPSRSIVDAALLGLRPGLQLASEEEDSSRVANALLEALGSVEGRPVEEAAQLIEERLGLKPEPVLEEQRESVAAAPRDADEGKEAQPPETPAVADSIDPVETLLAARIEGLREGPRCKGEAVEVELARLEPTELEGRYECCLLGCGGYGCVYRCMDSQGLVVAVKTPRGLDPWEASQATVPERHVERLAREASTLMKLRHPNIVRLLGYGQGAPLLIYEYASRGSLAWQLLRGWRPSVRDALITAVQIGDALRYVHSRGVVHGDVKPGNILFSEARAKLGDFSSAAQLLSAATAASLPGTPGWRSPEQVYLDLRRRAVERGLENRIDVYQLGNLTLYLLTGEALDGEEAVNTAKLEEALAAVRNPELREVLREMLTAEPWRRPSMEEAVKRIAGIAIFLLQEEG